MTRDVVLDKIKKLQNLAVGRNATPGEAAAAAAAVQRLLFEHRLTMVDVEQAQDQATKEQVGRHDVPVGGPQGFRKWRQALANTLARNNFAQVVYTQGGRSLAFVGREADVQVITWLYGYLGDEIVRLAREAAKRDGISAENNYPYIRAFCLGAVREIGARLAQQHRDDVLRGGSKATALVHVAGKAVEEAVARYFPKVRNARPAQANHMGAFLRGRAAGRTVNLNRPLPSGPSAGRLHA